MEMESVFPSIKQVAPQLIKAGKGALVAGGFDGKRLLWKAD